MKSFISLLLLFVLLGGIPFAFGAPNKPVPCGNVVTANGQVTVKGKQLNAGGPIYPEDEVLTGENSSVKFLMVDKSIIDLGASTSFKFEDYRDGENETRQAELSLQFGSVRASVTKKLDEKSKFHIRTKSSVLAVRGTEFLAKFETKDGKVMEQVTVGSGKVEMNTGGRMVALNPGNQYNASGTMQATEPGKAGTKSDGKGGEEKPVLAGEVTTLPPEKIMETLKEAKVEDKTFSETVTFEKRSTKEAKKKEDKVAEENKDKTVDKGEVAKENKENKEEKTAKEEKGSKSENVDKEEKTMVEKKAPEEKTMTAVAKEENNSGSNGTLGSVFQGVTGERLDGKAIVIAKGPDVNGSGVGTGPVLGKEGEKESDRKPAGEGDVAKTDSEKKGDEGPVIPIGYINPSLPPPTPGFIPGGSTTIPGVSNPTTTAQTVNITVTVRGL